jgi:hypothetical protein
VTGAAVIERMFDTSQDAMDSSTLEKQKEPLS